VSADAVTVACRLAEIGRRFHARGWVMGTSGNFSAVVSSHPLQLAITSSGQDKRALQPTGVVIVDEHGLLAQSSSQSAGGRPSAETLLHTTIARVRHARAILHTHSVWGTILSDLHAPAGGLGIEGYEMLKGLEGVSTHEHREWIPILENDQDMTRLARVVRETLGQQPQAHALLLRRHGLYTWGDTLADAERHVEILEFLFETLGRLSTAR
jgi:methylthioribulose-1-phosphate dehydratase